MRKLVSYLIIFILIMNITIPGFAAIMPKDSFVADDVIPCEVYILWDDGIAKVIGYESDEGNKVFLQYVNGILTQKNTIFASDGGVILQEFPSSNLADKYLHIDEYVYVSESCGSIALAASSINAGTITYRTADYGNPYYYYSLVCNYTAIERGYTTYTINGFLGAVIDLASLLVGAVGFTFGIACAYLDALLVALVINVINGVIKDAVTDTVSCVQVDYVWTVYDQANTDHWRNFYGSRYYVSDFKAALSPRYYYDGHTPNDWRTQELAVFFHDAMYSRFTWEVYSWT